MSISLAKRKNDQFREGSSILVACSRSPSCLVAVTERFLLAGQHHKSDYLFRKVCHIKPQLLTYSIASELIRKQLKVIGLNPKQYGLHSLSSGGASAAATAAIPNRLLMRHGGCHLESAKNMYIQETEETLPGFPRQSGFKMHLDHFVSFSNVNFGNLNFLLHFIEETFKFRTHGIFRYPNEV